MNQKKKIKDGFKIYHSLSPLFHSQYIIKYIENETKGIIYDLFEHYFDFSVPSAPVKQLNNKKKKNKNNKLVVEIKKDGVI